MDNSNTEPNSQHTSKPEIEPTANGNLSPVGGGESLPCLFRNNSIEIEKSLSKKHLKNSVALATNVEEMAKKYGLKNLGFLTLTFADHVTDYKEGSKRFNSLATNILNTRYLDWIRVMERQKSGRIHYHLVVALTSDIRSGAQFDAFANRDYRSANSALRSEWAFWRKTAKLYSFGRTELMPVRSTEEGIARYVGKYISKHFEARLPDDKGARLVAYSKGVRVMNTKFAWNTAGGAVWRHKVGLFVGMVSSRTGCEPSFEGLKSVLGNKWAHNHRDFIAGL